MNIIRIILANKNIRALLLLLSGLTIGAFLLSYHRGDNSANLASINIVSNIGGSFGAIVADLLYQIFGLASFILPLCFISWAIKIYKNNYLTYKIIRILATICALCTFSISISNFNNIKSLPTGAGGIVGELLLPYVLEYDDIGIILVFISSVGFALLAMGINVYNHHDLYTKILNKSSLPFVKLKNNFTNKWNNSADPYYPKAEFGFLQQKDIIINKSTPPLSQISQKSAPNPRATPDKSVKITEYKQLSLLDGNVNENLLPPIELLDIKSDEKIKPQSHNDLMQRANDILAVLGDFGVKGKMIDIMQGPVVTMYEFEPAAGTKSSRVIGLSEDIARSLSALSTRIAIIPGRNALGIELPNQHRMFFRLRELIETEEFKNPNISLPIVLGKDLAGKPLVVDLAQMPHLLVAGTTGSGKSVAINTMIMSLLYRYTPEECRMIMIDPKMLELSAYDGIPHLLTPVVTEPGKAIVALKWAVKEMENRYRLMSHLGVRNLANYNTKILEAAKNGEVLERKVQTGFDTETGKPTYDTVPIDMNKMPFIVVVVDEMADLMLVAGKDIEASIQRLAQMARAAGIHIIMATQRPSVDVITGVIKANFPSRISFKVTSKIDSRTILGEQGAEQLLGMGDMLYMGNSSRILRVHGPFVDDNEVEKVTKFLRDNGIPKYISAVTESIDEELGSDVSNGDNQEDEVYLQAVNIVRTERKSSISYIQRSLRIGYNRAANIVEMMEKNGVLSEPSSSGRREVLLPEN